MEAVRLADRILMMVPNPGRILHEFPLLQPHDRRDTAWVYGTLAELMQVETVRVGFGLASGPLPEPVFHSHDQGCPV
jgi:NitT/TauT family transport system ATP-binding protein